MSAIIDAGENLMLDRQVSVAQIKTQGGRRVAQKRGPTLYNLEVDVPAQRMNGDVYYGIENEVISLEYGRLTFNSASISGQIGGNFTSVRGNWTAGAVSAASGTQVTFSSLTGTPMPFDYFQMAGSTKVYQVESVSGMVITANTPVVPAAGNIAAAKIGDDVQFNFALMSRPQTSYQPGGIVQYGTFKFEEVIE